MLGNIRLQAQSEYTESKFFFSIFLRYLFYIPVCWINKESVAV